MAFGGRIIDTKNKYAKYINSPETNFFRKGNNLYKLDKVKTIGLLKEELKQINNNYMNRSLSWLNKFNIIYIEFSK